MINIKLYIILLIFIAVTCNSVLSNTIEGTKQIIAKKMQASIHPKRANQKIISLFSNENTLICKYLHIYKKPKIEHTESNRRNLKTDCDCLFSDSLRIDGVLKTYSHFDSLISIFGVPDTILSYNETDDFYDEPYSLIEYKFMQLRLFDNGKTHVSKLTLESNHHHITYGKLILDKNTLLEDLRLLFPNASYKQDKVYLNGRHFVALRFCTGIYPTDDQWILLFDQNKLKFIHYFDGND